MRNHFRRIAFPVSLVVLMLIAAAPSYGSLTAPVPTAPTNGGTFDTPPVFAWNSVAGADHYHFQLAADSAFASISTEVDTKNTRETVIAPLQNGTYYWRVRAVTATGAVSNWSAPRSIVLNWSDVATPQSPTQGASLTYPQPVLLNWAAVPYAQQYSVKLASDAGLSNLVSGFPLTTSATAFSPTARLASGTYYWSVTPLDATGHPGTPSPVYHFTWTWPTTSTLTVTDLDASSQVFDPQFSWTAVPGAESYDIEINRDASFSGSPAFTQTGVIGTSLTPQTLLPAATYYWRVRAEPPNGSPGAWNVYQDPLNPGNAGTFTIAYDTGANAISNLTMLDYQTGASDWSQGYTTDAPIVSWDPVPGAASYEVEVTLFTGGICDWTQGSPNEWDDTTAATTWTPLGNGWNGNKPFSANANVATDSSLLVQGDEYCVRVKAERNNDSNNQLVWGSWTSLGNGNDQPSFTFGGYPSGNACTAPCATNYPGNGDYLGPIQGATSTTVPLFTWNPIAGKTSYFVIVATDPTFQHVVDYAFTQEPAYAPRTGNTPTTYADSNSEYYWAVLPATGFNGSAAAGDPTGPDEGGLNYPQNFFVHSDPPTLISPANSSLQTGQPTFQWTPVDGAYYYTLTVTGPNNFSQSINTDEASYTGNTTYPVGNGYSWSVHAVDRTGLPMAPSATGTFNKVLSTPTFASINPANPTSGDTIPVWQWDAMPGAIAYDVHVNLPDGTTRDFNGLDTTAFTATSMTGTGIFQWQVRAQYPVQSGGTVTSSYTALQQFTRTVHAPTGNTATAAAHQLVFSWAPKDGAKQYNVQVSNTTSFANSSSWTTDETRFSPDMENSTMFDDGGTLYWRVQAIDADGNHGAFTATQAFHLPVKLFVTSSGYFQKGQKKTVTITVKDGYGHAVAGVSVKVSGAGVVTTTKKTNSAGKAAFALKATRTGTVSVTATKTNCVAGTEKITVFM